jgi:CheY-like chemotaxis protein
VIMAETRGGSARPFSQGKAILIVTGEPGAIAMLAEILAVHGHRVETAGNVVMALVKLRQRAYGVILSDLRIPSLYGSSLYRQVARDH